MTAPRSRIPRRPRKTTALALAPLDAVRWSKVLSAQARIASGYYEREEIRECVVDALIEELEKR